MSRGPGRHQRALLDLLAHHDAVMVTNPDASKSEQVAQRRAAYTLERAGRLTLVSQRVGGHPRLVAYRPGTTAATRRVVGGDGKTYRVPGVGIDMGWRCERTEYDARLLKSDAVVTMHESAWRAADPILRVLDGEPCSRSVLNTPHPSSAVRATPAP